MPSAAPLPRSPSIVTLYSAADLLRSPGCPVCQYAAEASDRYLAWMALEGHAQMTTITRLCASLGACPAHTRRLAGQPGAASRLTAMYRYIVTAAADQLTGRRGRLMACMACEHDTSAAMRALDTLLEGLADNTVRDRCQDLGGLCLTHLDAAAHWGRHRDVVWLAGLAQQTLSATAQAGWLAGIDCDAETRAALRAALPTSGVRLPSACPACLSAAQAERDVLDRLLGLAGDFPWPPEPLCGGHLADAVMQAGLDSVRALLTSQARTMAGRLGSRPARRIRPRLRRESSRPKCLACREYVHAAQRVLGDRLEPRAREWLCVRHRLGLGEAGQRQRGDAVQLHAAAGRAAGLAAELADAFEYTARARSRGAHAPVSTAWKRAAVFIDGGVFGGMPPGPP